MNYRVGQGFDFHRFCEGNIIRLGGVNIMCEVGIKAHSDGDILLHSIIDAILGACGLPDIGELFPDTDNKYLNIDSKTLLKEVLLITKSKNINIINIDNVIICDQPKISPHKQTIISELSNILGLKQDRINLKGKTTEGILGNTHGISCISVCLVLCK